MKKTITTLGLTAGLLLSGAGVASAGTHTDLCRAATTAARAALSNAYSAADADTAQRWWNLHHVSLREAQAACWQVP